MKRVLSQTGLDRSPRMRSAFVLGLVAVLLAIPQLAVAQSDKDDKDDKDKPYAERVVVTGTRAQPRSVVESMVPIDVISGKEFEEQGETDLNNLLRTIVPSFNVNAQPISDAATVVRPANLRNLAPDHTLVLVNGKRRHRAAVIYWLGNGVADGAQGADISAIPSLALRQVEVLRDGASAQYGSDAIAGVINFLLKDNADGGVIEVRYGEYQEGDGSTATIAGNFGLPMGKQGFANLSFEFGESDPTDRSIQRTDAAGLIAAGNIAVANPAQVWGNPEIEDDLKLWGNFGYLFSNGTNWYAHANYVTKTVTGGFFYRNPNTRAAVFSNDGGATLLIGDVQDAMDGVDDNTSNCPTVTITGNVPDPNALMMVQNDPNCFSFQELFPGGFTPQFGGDVEDMALTTGFRGKFGDKTLWDASIAFGSNEVDFFISNTVNASLGPNTPTTFDPGLYKQEDLNINFDISHPINDNLNLAAGVEYRDETFQIGIGQPESFEIGPYASQGFSAASNGFPGFSDVAAGEWSRNNYAVYGDIEYMSDNNRYSFGAAVRFEDFEDFGTTTNGKLAGRFRANDNVQLRASVSTGFRAPTPGQSNAFNVSTEFDQNTMELVNNGTVPSTSPVAAAVGGVPIDAEESVNYTVGAVFEGEGLTVTADFFSIDLKDRITLSQNFMLSPQQVIDLVNAGITSAANLQNFRFFTNDFDTRTQGVDFVATWVPAQYNGDTQFSLLVNYTDTEVTKFNAMTLDSTRIRELQEGLPDTRVTLSYNQDVTEAFRFLIRGSYYDDWFDSEEELVATAQNEGLFGGKTLFDVEASYTFDDRFTVVLGGQNVLDTFPGENFNPGDLGRAYSQYSPFGFNGAFWYARLKYAFRSNI